MTDFVIEFSDKISRLNLSPTLVTDLVIALYINLENNQSLNPSLIYFVQNKNIICQNMIYIYLYIMSYITRYTFFLGNNTIYIYILSSILTVYTTK